MRANSWLEGGLAWLLHHSLQAGVLVLLVLLVQWLFRRQLSSRWRFALWWVVLVRLLIPYGPESAISLFNFLRPPIALRAPAVMVRVQPAVPTVPEAMPTYQVPRQVEAVELPQHTSRPETSVPPVQPPVVRHSEPTAPALNIQDWLMPGLAGLWLAGILALGVGVVVQLVRFGGRLARSSQPADAALQELLADCRREFGVRRRIELIETDAVDSPALFGLFRLRLLLPRGITQRFSSREMRYIFMHEMAHVKRGDLWLNWLITALQIVHWFNPLVWLGFARLRADRELACDELALLRAGETVGTPYGETIVKLLEGLGSRTTIPGLVGILEDGQQMRRRILMIANFSKRGRSSVLALVLLAAIAATMLTDAQTQKTPAVKSKQDGTLREAGVKPNSKGWRFSGHVIDADSGQPVEKFTITTGKGSVRGLIEWDSSQSFNATKGQFLTFVDRHNPAPVVLAEADGFLPAALNFSPGEVGDAEFVLKKGVGPSGRVILPDGTARAGIKVVLLCNGNNPPTLASSGGWVFPAKGLIEQTTDADGRFAFKPGFNMTAVAAASPEGFKVLRVAMLATNSKIALEPYGGITGTLQHDSEPATSEQITLEFAADPQEAWSRISLQHRALPDSEGKFQFDHVPVGKIWIYNEVRGYAPSVRRREEVTMGSNQVLVVDLKANFISRSDLFNHANFLRGQDNSDPNNLKAIAGAQLKGVVLLPGGKPAEGATVALDVKGIPLHLGKAALSSSQGPSLIVNADAHGHFTLQKYEGARSVIAVHEQGYAKISLEQLKASPVITLQKWSGIEGVVKRGGKVAANLQMWVHADWSQAPFYDPPEFNTRTDDGGRFVFTYLPPGEHTVSELVPTGEHTSAGRILGRLDLKEGEILTTNFVEGRRIVSGRLDFIGTDVPTNFENLSVTLSSDSSALTDLLSSKIGSIRSPSTEQLKTVLNSEEYRRASLDVHFCPGIVLPDGSFRVEGVPAGKYTLNVDTMNDIATYGEPRGFSSHEGIVIPEVAENDTAPVELGFVELKRVSFAASTPAETQIQAAPAKRITPISKSVPRDENTRPDLSGQIVDKDGTPLAATVFISTAGPKIGTSTFCPSCYADCRKSTPTDALGTFRIESLDPKLRFRVLVVAKDYQPQFVSKVDPANGPIRVEMVKAERSAAKPGNSIRGRVLDPAGQPVAHAVVEMKGVRNKDGGGTWGALENVDPLAVTDEAGEFVLTARDPFESMDVGVSARTFATKTFQKLASGTQRHDLTVAEGATVTGRLLLEGKPLKDISVGLVSVDRDMDNFTGNFDVGTDANGTFTFENIPPGVEYYIYGSMATLKAYGAIPVQKLHAGKDGETTKVGDLVVSPAHRLKGKVVLDDGGEVPANTQLLVSRDKAWDVLQITLEDDGSFDTQGIPTEGFSLSARIKGYRVSAQNGSLDTLNPYGLVGQIDRDITNLVFLMEKGSDLPPNHNMNKPQSEWPQNLPLRGAETVADHSRDWAFSGRVLDAETQQPIPSFIITAGQRQNQFDMADWDSLHPFRGTNGKFLAYVSKRSNQPLLKAEAEGYLPASKTLVARDANNVDFTLKKGVGPRGKVVSPDGKPVAGTKVVLLCDGPQQITLSTKGELSSWQNHSLEQITDADGHFSFNPELGMSSVVAASGGGFKLITVEALASDDTIVLEAYGRISGTLKRKSGPGAKEELDVRFVGMVTPGRPYIYLQSRAVTGAEGQFEFDHIPPGKLAISYREASPDQRSWENLPLREVVLKPGESLEVNIETGDRPPLKDHGSIYTPTKAKPIAGAVIKGSVLLPNGKPAEGAEVALAVEGLYLALGKATFNTPQRRDEGLIVNTRPDGGFAFQMHEGAKSVIAVHEEGYAEVSLEKLKASPQITLQKWGGIEGVLQKGGRAATKIKVSIDHHPSVGDSNLFYRFEMAAFQALTDEVGRFVFTYVPPGELTLFELVPTGEGSSMSLPRGHLVIKPGETLATNISISGRTVVGTLKMSGTNGAVDLKNASVSFRPPMTRFLKHLALLTTPEEKKAFMESEEIKSVKKNFWSYPASILPDGSFRAEVVPAGKYELNLHINNPHINSETVMFTSVEEVVIPESKGETDGKPFDLGVIELQRFALPVVAPPPAQPSAATNKPAAALSHQEDESRASAGGLDRATEHEIEGIVLLPDGKAAVGAEVALDVEGGNLLLGKATLKSWKGNKKGVIVKTGADGGFRFQPTEGTKSVMAVHEEGYVKVSLEELKRSPQIKLQKWASIESVLTFEGRQATNMMLSVRSIDHGLPQFNQFASRALTDDHGRFSFNYLPPSEYRLSRVLKVSDQQTTFNEFSQFTLQAGETLVTNFGGNTRTVVGRLSFRKGDEFSRFQDALVSLHKNAASARKLLARFKTPEELKAFNDTDEWRNVSYDYLHHTGELGRYGTFRAVGVSEGKYEVQLETKDEIYRSSVKITVKPGTEENGFLPLDIGVIELRKVDFSKQGLNEANN